LEFNVPFQHKYGYIRDELPSGEGRSLGAQISGGKGRPPANILIPLERQLTALQFCRQPNFARCLAVSWASTLYIHFRGLLSPREFCQGQNSLCGQVLRSHILATLHSSSGRQPNFAAWYREWNYCTFTEGATCFRQGGHHVGHRPTF